MNCVRKISAKNKFRQRPFFSFFLPFNTRIYENIFTTKQGIHAFAIMTRVLLIVITRPR